MSGVVARCAQALKREEVGQWIEKLVELVAGSVEGDSLVDEKFTELLRSNLAVARSSLKSNISKIQTPHSIKLLIELQLFDCVEEVLKKLQQINLEIPSNHSLALSFLNYVTLAGQTRKILEQSEQAYSKFVLLAQSSLN